MSNSDEQPYQMTSEEFYKTFPLFSELSPQDKWRLYRIHNKINVEETGEECTYTEFCEFASEPFRWDVKNANVLWSDDHSYYIKEALHWNFDVPDEVLAEYPELVEEFVKKRQQQQKLRERRAAKIKQEKEDEKFWEQFK